MQTLKTFLFIAMAITTSTFAKAQQFNYKLDGPFKTFKTFKVQGACEMCKYRIENSVINLPGIWSSYWDLSSKTLQVSYDRTKVNPAMIEKLVSAKGHDIESTMVSSVVYNQLPECCKYKTKS